MADPFQAGFMVGLEQRRMQNEEKYKTGLLERLKQETEANRFELEQKKASAAAPGEFLQSISAKDTGPFTPAPIPPSLEPDEYSESRGPSPEDIVKENTALGPGGPVKPTLEEKLRSYVSTRSKYPQNQQAVDFVATQDPDIRNYMQQQALAAKRGEKAVEFEDFERKERLKYGFDMGKEGFKHLATKDQKSSEEANKITIKGMEGTAGFVTYKGGKPIATFIQDPKNPANFIPRNIADVDFSVMRHLVSNLPGSDKKSSEELDAMASGALNNQQMFQQVVNENARMQAGKTGKAVVPPAGAPASDSSGTASFLWNLLSPAFGGERPGNAAEPPKQTYEGIRDAAHREAQTKGARPSVNSEDALSRLNTPSPEQGAFVQSVGKSLSSTAGKTWDYLKEKTKSPVQLVTENSSPTDRLQSAGVSIWAKSTTLAKGQDILARVFPELSKDQIGKILSPVRGKGESKDMIDLERLRADIETLYQLARKQD